MKTNGSDTRASRDGRQRVIIEGVAPEIDCGRHPAKRIIGDRVEVEADIFGDGHDLISARLLHRREGESSWQETPMEALVNDRWRAAFDVTELGFYEFTVTAWTDHFKTWHRDLKKRVAAGDDVSVQFLIGAEMIEGAASRAKGADEKALASFAADLRGEKKSAKEKLRLLFEVEFYELVMRYPDRTWETRYERVLPIQVDREKARYSTWYELFPRSASTEPGKHGTFRDVIERLDYVERMGFDVLYMPPIHPIGKMHRKGKNNNPKASDGDVGSPWAIGSDEGGHTAIHPDLGTIDDFRDLVKEANARGIEIALDIAFQAAPDHPWVKEHPEWFLWRPDGTVQYAENPPKKYQDIYPFHFESEKWRELWDALKGVFDYWIGEGVKIFRVDNPHTKPLPFWEWVIGEIRREHPDVIFLSEAFTRPRVRYSLAKGGFTQSYTYFAWRNTKRDLTEYLTELTTTEVRDYFRPNFWPNTPDILTEYLQYGGRAGFMSRLVLAATLSSNYGIYGPAYELQEHKARDHGGEEYLDSEKYQLRAWNLADPDSLSELIGRVNRIRRENEALQQTWNIEFHPIGNENLICYSKTSIDGRNTILCVVNLDPYNPQSGELELPLADWGIEEGQAFQLHDLLSGARFIWHRAKNSVTLNPHVVPAHIFRVRRRIRSEHDFEYFL